MLINSNCFEKTEVRWEKYLIISYQAIMKPMKLERVGYIPCCMERGLCAGFRLPLKIALSYKTHKAANGIQRFAAKRCF